MAKIVTQDGQEFTLQKGRNVLGRGSKSNIVIRHKQVSRYHAEIRWEDGRYVIADLGSTNGTFVNGQRLEAPRTLQHGDEIGLGPEVTLSFWADVPAAEMAEAALGPALPILPLAAGGAVLLIVLLLVIFGSRPTVIPAQPTPTQAAKLVATPVPTLSPAVSPPLQPTSTLAPTPIPTPTLEQPSTPTVPPATLTPAKPAYPAPTLLGPDDGASFSGPDAIVALRWGSVGDLAADEYYDVSLRYRKGGEIQYSGTWTKDTSYQVPSFLCGRADGAEFMWDVTVRRQTGTRADGGKTGPAIGPTSQTRRFYWQRGGAPPGPGPSPTFEKVVTPYP